MEIHIKPGESLVIFARDACGNEKTFKISHREMMQRGETIIDGLTLTEIEALQSRKKIRAIKLFRERTNLSIHDSKLSIEEWAENHHCCSRWPNCTHMECVSHMDPLLAHKGQVGLANHWHYEAELTEQQCRAIMSLWGCPANKFGFYSYRVELGVTFWSSNAFYETQESEEKTGE